MLDTIRLLVCALLLTLVGSVFAQEEAPPLDSLRQITHDESLADTIRLQAHHELATFYLYTYPDSALFHIGQALAIAARQPDPKWIAMEVAQKGRILSESGQFDQATSLLDSAVNMFAKIGMRRQQAEATVNLGMALSQQGEVEVAMQTLEGTEKLWQELDDPMGWVKVKANMGGLMGSRGEFAKALSYMQEALDLMDGIENPEMKAKLLSSLSAFSRGLGDYEAVTRYAQQSNLIAEQIGDTKLILRNWYNISHVLEMQGDIEGAIGYAERSVALARESENPVLLIKTLNVLGATLIVHEKYESGIPHMEEVLRVSEEIGDQRYAEEALNLLGYTYTHLGQLDKAETYLSQAEEKALAIGDRRYLAKIYDNFSRLYLEKEAYPQALSYIEKSIQLNQAMQNANYLGTALLMKAQIEQQIGNGTAAIQTYRQARNLAIQLGHLSFQRRAAEGLYALYKAQGNASAALAAYEEMITVKDSLAREENERAVFRYEYEQQALQDSLTNVQERNAADMVYQKNLSQRNYLLMGALALIILGGLGFLFFRNQQRIRLREQELDLAAERARQEQLTEMDQLKSRFFTNISHEFRTPLTVILGMADQLPQPQEQAKSLIRRNGQRLLRLINQLLDLSRLEAQGLRLEYQQGDIISHLRYVLSSFEATAKQQQIELKVDAKAEELVMDFDPAKVEDIVYNIVSNALKHTPTDGQIKMNIEQNGDRLEVAISDNGEGIRAAELPHVFDRFFQGAAAARETSTGVGLSLVKALVDEMGGEIRAESQPGQGATFTFWLPIKKGGKTPLVQPAAAEVMGSDMPMTEPLVLAENDPQKPEVLVIEDNPDVITYLSAMLGSRYNLLTATDGTSGVDLARERVPDLIITDVMMPGLNGYEVTEALKTDERTSHIPIIMLTAKATQQDRLEGLSQGADAYLSKPFDQQELFIRIDQLLNLRKTLQAKYVSKAGLAGEVASADAEAVKPKEPTLDDLFLEKVQGVIKRKLIEPDLSIHDLCEATDLTRTQVYRKIKALTGFTPTLLIRNIRLQRAKELLDNSNLNISEIGYDVGFSDPSYFTRVFTKAYGVSPTKYREAPSA